MGNLRQKIVLVGIVGFAIAANLIGAKSASAQPLVRCESINFRYRACSLDTRDGVFLEAVYSQEACKFDRNWGIGRGFVWVDDGCRALFSSARNRECDDEYYDDCRDSRRSRRQRVRRRCPQACEDFGR